MTKSILLAALVPLALGGCVTFKETGPKNTMPEPSTQLPTSEAGGFECDASKGQYAIGKKTSVELATKLLKETGSERLRWIPPRTAVTLEFNALRVNITYDDAMVITAVSCG